MCRPVMVFVAFVLVALGLLAVCMMSGADSSHGAAAKALIEVSAAGIERLDQPVEVGLDLADLLPPAFAQRSVRSRLSMLEVDRTGSPIGGPYPCQFDPDAPDSTTGTLIFAMPGRTPADAVRRFRLSVDEDAGDDSLAAQPVAVEDGVLWGGQESLKITTSSGTWFYQKAGASFASLIDSDGNDWISYSSAQGSAGEYRGIPNFPYPEAYFHPGSNESVSNLISAGPIRVRIESQSNDGQWACRWDIFPRYARMTLTRAPAEVPYWFLYEGTPGGKLDEAGQYCLRSGGEKSALSEKWTYVLPAPEWVCFVDPPSRRGLMLIHHEADDAIDSYWPMESNMTVFGFGRDGISKHMLGAPTHFTVALVAEAPIAEMQKMVEAICENVEVAIKPGSAQ